MGTPGFSSNGAGSTSMGGYGSNGGFSEDDLLASLASFGVEGQTERDLATIKAMLSNGSGANGVHAFQQAAVAQQGWNAYLQTAGNPPPNTPTLGKSLELQGMNIHLGTPSGSSGTRRRDVSLDRDYLNSLQYQQLQAQQQQQPYTCRPGHNAEQSLGMDGIEVSDNDDAMDCGEGTSYSQSVSFQYQSPPPLQPVPIPFSFNQQQPPINHQRYHHRRKSGHGRTSSTNVMEDIVEEDRFNADGFPSQTLQQRSGLSDVVTSADHVNGSASPLQFRQSNNSSPAPEPPTTRSRSRAIAAAAASRALP